jgi:LmbE family N-acetylglucosaminyl deacetylase
MTESGVFARLGVVGGPVAVVVAHPDDETVGAGAQLPHWRGVTFVYVTDGSPRNPADATAAGFATREAYAQARRAEVRAALALAGTGPARVRELGRADQEASLDMATLSRDLAALLRELRPAVVVTHPYEGGHPDHDATAFAARAACRLIARHAPAPALVEMASYHGAPGRLVANEFLPADSEVVRMELSGAERAFKLSLVACYRSQARPLSYLPVGIESFRVAPDYDFTRPPHGGRLWYERFDWGMTGPRWRELAAGSLARLGLRGRG